MARRADLLSEQVGAELVVYDLKRKDVHCLAPLAAAVFELADGSTPVDRLSQSASERLGERVSQEQVLDALAQLGELNLVSSQPIPTREPIRVSRRQAIRTGAAVAALPLVVSIAAPTSAAAATQFCTCTCRCCSPQNPGCGPNGTQASNDQDCCIGLSCNCTIAESDGIKRCKPGNAGAVNCADRIGQFNCVDGSGNPICATL